MDIRRIFFQQKHSKKINKSIQSCFWDVIKFDITKKKFTAQQNREEQQEENDYNAKTVDKITSWTDVVPDERVTQERGYVLETIRKKTISSWIRKFLHILPFENRTRIIMSLTLPVIKITGTSTRPPESRRISISSPWHVTCKSRRLHLIVLKLDASWDLISFGCIRWRDDFGINIESNRIGWFKQCNDRACKNINICFWNIVEGSGHQKEHDRKYNHCFRGKETITISCNHISSRMPMIRRSYARSTIKRNLLKCT